MLCVTCFFFISDKKVTTSSHVDVLQSISQKNEFEKEVPLKDLTNPGLTRAFYRENPRAQIFLAASYNSNCKPFQIFTITFTVSYNMMMIIDLLHN